MDTKVGIKIEEVGEALVFSIEGHLDASMVNAVNERATDVLESSYVNVVFDFSKLVYISSAVCVLCCMWPKRPKPRVAR